MTEAQQRPVRYFWSDLFDGRFYGALAVLFVLFSVVDLLATLRLMPHGVQEGNQLANSIFTMYGATGMAVFKILLVGVVMLATGVVRRSNARLAAAVLGGGVVVMAVLGLMHLTIISGMLAGM